MASQPRSVLSVAVAGALLSAGAHAQSNAGVTELEEVVVTAQKTGTQALQSVPLAIQAFDGAELKEKNITTIGDLVSSVPGAFEGQPVVREIGLPLRPAAAAFVGRGEEGADTHHRERDPQPDGRATHDS